MKLPKAKLENIVVQDLKGELLVYNLTTHQAFTLNKTLRSVYSACDGTTTFAELKRQYKFTDDLIYLALDELATNDLLEDYQSDHFKGLSRREAIRRVGLASMIVLPMITSLTAPKAINAASSSDPIIDYCEEIECANPTNVCRNQSVCCNDAEGCGPGINPSDCYETNRPDGTPCSTSLGNPGTCSNGDCEPTVNP